MGVDTTFNNEFEAQLEAAGYRWFQDRWKGSRRGFQKRIRDEKGTKYFVTGYHWNFGKTFPDRAPDRDQYSFDVQFKVDEAGKDNCIDIQFGGDFLPNEYGRKVTTLKEVEEFYERMWEATNAEYYEYNDN